MFYRYVYIWRVLHGMGFFYFNLLHSEFCIIIPSSFLDLEPSLSCQSVTFASFHLRVTCKITHAPHKLSKYNHSTSSLPRLTVSHSCSTMLPTFSRNPNSKTHVGYSQTLFLSRKFSILTSSRPSMLHTRSPVTETTVEIPTRPI